MVLAEQLRGGLQVKSVAPNLFRIPYKGGEVESRATLNKWQKARLVYLYSTESIWRQHTLSFQDGLYKAFVSGKNTITFSQAND